MLTTRRQWAPLYERHEERYRSPQRNSQSCSVADVRLSAWSKNRLPDRSALCGWCHEEVPTPDKESAAPSPTFWGSWARCLCCRCRQAHVCACAPSAFLTPFYVQCDQLLKGTHECRALAKFPRRGVYNEADDFWLVAVSSRRVLFCLDRNRMRRLRGRQNDARAPWSRFKSRDTLLHAVPAPLECQQS